MTHDPRMEELSAQLADIDHALDRDQLELVGELLARHDSDMRMYLRSLAGDPVQRMPLDDLLRRQLHVQARMAQMREQAASAMDAASDGGRASRAYLSTKSS